MSKPMHLTKISVRSTYYCHDYAINCEDYGYKFDLSNMTLVQSKLKKVPRGIQDEKSRKDTAFSGKLANHDTSSAKEQYCLPIIM